MKKYKKSKEELVDRIYAHQKSSSKKRGHSLPTYTKQDLKHWLFSQPLFHVLYDNWKVSGYKSELRPSVDRKKDDVGYVMLNIQLTTWKQNRSKFLKSEKNKNKNLEKGVAQYDMKGQYLGEYVSIKTASEVVGVDSGDISRVCKGKRKSAGGYIWKLKKEGKGE